MPISPKAKRLTCALVASTLGITLIVGGSTYALWSSAQTSNTQAIISNGDLQVTSVSPQKWFDVTNADAPKQIDDLDAFRMAPGDSIRLKQNINVVVVGDNMSGILEVLVPNETLSDPLLTQGKLTLSLFDKEGVEVGSITPDVNTADSLSLEVLDLPRTPAAGESYTIQLTVALPTVANNDTKLQVGALADMLINLKQGAALAEPIVFLAGNDLGKLTLGAASSKIALVESSTKDPVTLKLTSGRLPNGVTLSGNSLEGSPTQLGTFNFEVEAKNSTFTKSRSYTLVTNLTAVQGWQSVTVDGIAQKFYNAQLSSDGTKMVSSSPDGAYISSNGGLTWTKIYSGNNGQALVSADGAKILFVGKPNVKFSKSTLDSSYTPITMTKTLPIGYPNTVLSESGIGLSVSGSSFYDTNYRDFEWNTFTLGISGANRVSVGGNRFVVDSTGTNRIGFGAGGFAGMTGTLTKPTGLGNTVSSISADGKVVITGQNGAIYIGTAVQHPSGNFLNPVVTLKASGKGVWQDIKILNNGTLIGLQDGKLKKSTDSGVNWTDISPVTLPIVAMNIPSSAGGKIMLTVNGGTENYILQGTL